MRFVLLLLMFGFMAPVFAQTFKRLPPPGIKIDDDVRLELQTLVDSLRQQLQQVAADDPRASWATDIDVLVRAVDLALTQDIFYKPVQVKQARELLNEAERRLAERTTAEDRLSWIGWEPAIGDEPQMLVGGYRSSIDDSVQPFGLVLPEGFGNRDETYRLDVWLHGRGDSKTEIPFLVERMTKPGQYTPANTVVLHPFGRHCNAFKFAGEVDVLEAIDHVMKLIPIDRDRISIRGFSMGGAGCWHLAAHYPGHWFAANPGAGFVDTIVYQGWDRKPKPFEIDPVQQKLLRWYDVLPWAKNLGNTRVIAYSGEVDKQKQAADRVMDVAKQLGLSFEYVIGEKMGHKINRESALQIDRTLESWAGSLPSHPRRNVDFITYSLRYPGVAWLRADGLREHWTASTARGELIGEDRLKIETEGITHLVLDFSESGKFEGVEFKVEIDGDRFMARDRTKGGGFFARLIRTEEGWFQLDSKDQRLRKRAGLQGPIDDAFCGRFLFVIPSRPATHGAVERWVARELDYARERWKKIMRGDVREVLDTELTDEQIENNHLICFGDFQSNRFLNRVAARLPMGWTMDSLSVGEANFDPAEHALVMCYPNPKNPDRYIVVNSGMTFREFSNVSNSRQIAMLPDWAVIDVRESDDSIFPGRVADAGFFDEQWQLNP